MYRRCVVMTVLITTGCLCAAANGQAAYTASGAGSSNRSADEALTRALRTALTRILDDHFQEYSKGQEQSWIRELVKAHPRHVIQKDYEIVSSTDPDQDLLQGRHSRTVRVHLPEQRLAEACKEAAQFLENLGGGSPTVAIFQVCDRIEENVGGVHSRIAVRQGPGDASIEGLGIVEADRRTEMNSRESWVAQQLEERLQKLQFTVHVIDQVERLRPAQGEFAELSQQDMEVLRELATRQGADIFVVCYAHVIGPEADDRTTPGRITYFWDATAKAKVYWTDNGEVLATLDGKGEEGKTNGFAARIDALRSAGDNLAPRIVDAIFEKWSICAFEGRMVALTVLGCNAHQALQIKRALQDITGDKRVNAQPANKTTTLRFKHRGPADELAAAMCEKSFDGFRLSLMESRYNTIRVKLEN